MRRKSVSLALASTSDNQSHNRAIPATASADTIDSVNTATTMPVPVTGLVVCITKSDFMVSDLDKYLKDNLKDMDDVGGSVIVVKYRNTQGINTLLKLHRDIKNIYLFGLVNGYTRDLNGIVISTHWVTDTQESVISSLRASGIVDGISSYAPLQQGDDNMSLVRSKSAVTPINNIVKSNSTDRSSSSEGVMRSLKRTLSRNLLTRSTSNTSIDWTNSSASSSASSSSAGSSASPILSNKKSVSPINLNNNYQLIRALVIIGYPETDDTTYNKLLLGSIRSYLNISSDIQIFTYFDQSANILALFNK